MPNVIDEELEVPEVLRSAATGVLKALNEMPMSFSDRSHVLLLALGRYLRTADDPAVAIVFAMRRLAGLHTILTGDKRPLLFHKTEEE